MTGKPFIQKHVKRPKWLQLLIGDDYGNIFDCVDIYKQPAFDHPSVKNHTIQVPTISLLEKISSNSSSKKNMVNFCLKERCPSGTVVIRRTTMEDLLRARKYAQYIFLGKKKDSHHIDYINGDSLTHFFIIWTSDGYQRTGCYNMLCPGFIQLSSVTTPGMVFPKRSGVIKLATFRDDFGNIFDCVDIYKQLAFDHPLLKNHTIQMPTISLLEKISSKPSSKIKLVNFGLKERCPSGTVLIRRTTLEDLLKARKHVQYINPMAETRSGGHKAILAIRDIKFYGAQAEMDVFTHPNVTVNQFTITQIVLTKGESGPKNYFNTIQFGWMIDYRGNGDSLTHFFIIWTSDGFQKTGCFNMLCPGFIQISNVTTPGMVFSEGSGAIKLSSFRDPRNLNWYLVREDNWFEIIGYWPKEIFNNMADISQVQMGGYAYSRLDEPSPPMGSGWLPNGYRRGAAAEFRQVQLIRGNGDRAEPTEANPFFYNDLDKVYLAGFAAQYPQTGYTFQYGGPGGWTTRS